MVTREDIRKAAEALGIKKGDTVLIHSSFKSFGGVEGGAESVVGGFEDAVGEEGTLVFPTLCQEDWEHVYETWYMDKPSDVGYLTNYFRKLPGAKRSNQATHSVAARGKDADYITATHGNSGLRHGIFGDTPFASDSPWEKLYERNAKTVFIGCLMHKCTFRHLIEYKFVEKLLERIEGTDFYEVAKRKLWCYERWSERGAWPLTHGEFIRSLLNKEGKVTYTKCGDAHIMCTCAKDYVDKGIECLEKDNFAALADTLPLYREWKAEYNEYVRIHNL